MPQALTFLSKPREEAIKDFEELLDKRLGDELKANTPIFDYQKTDALKAFVPTEWTGINGIEPLKLAWRDSLPLKMKPKAGPINPRLWGMFQERIQKVMWRLYRCKQTYGSR